MSRTYLPREMVKAPALPSIPSRAPIRPRHALLINPFYPKDPHASFGKHVLTPTLALTRITRSRDAVRTSSRKRLCFFDGPRI